ncbi:VCBS domain-containing protein [Mycolicibacterium vinylchloridicum]|uniref:VCBS domain-containing protein n=1 Tax=Mycolicibacterium vinylchloridicum TaxID=2736928 RepID=UPI0015C76585|nr:YncE family protein [Mycolicibacterium vinylchloridicum]
MRSTGTARPRTLPAAGTTIATALRSTPTANINPVTDTVARLMAALVNMFGVNTPTPPANPLGGVAWRVFRSINTALGFVPLAGTPTVSQPDPTTGTVTGTWVFTQPAGLDLNYGFSQAANGTVHVYTDGTYSYTPTETARQTATATTTDSFLINAADSVASTNLVITVPVLPFSHTAIPVTVGKLPVGVAVSPAGPAAGYIYTTNLGDGTVSVINPATNAVTATITVGGIPNGVAIIPNGPKAGYVYVTGTRWYGTHSDQYNGVSVIDPTTNTVVDRIAYAPDVTLAVAASPVGAGYIYVEVAGTSGNYVSVIDPTTNTIVTSVGVGKGSSGTEVAVSPAGPKTGYVYVANTGDNTVSVINPATNTATTVNVGQAPTGVAVVPTGPKAGYVYVTNFGGGTVSVIDPTTNTITATIDVGHNPWIVAVSPTGPRAGYVYVANFTLTSPTTPTGIVQVIDPATNAVVDTMIVNTSYNLEGGIAISDAGKVYVTNGLDPTMWVISSG